MSLELAYPLLLVLPPAWRGPFVSVVIPMVGAAVLIVAALWLALRLVRRAVWGRFHLPGRVVLITGAGAGIGRELAIQFVEAGCRVVLVDIRTTLLQAVQKELLARHGAGAAQVLAWRCDVADRRAVATMAKQVQEAVAPSHVSVVVNNAGVVMGKPLCELSDEQVERTMGVNCMAHFWVTRAFLPEMVRRDDGVVVGMSSLMGLMAGASLTDYCASKWAVVGFLESVRLEMRRQRRWGVNTLAVCPFAVDTGMFSGIFRSEAADSWIRRTLFPFLATKHVAASVVRSVYERDSLLVLPWMLRYLPFIAKLFPVGLYDWAVELMAGCHGMDEFAGRGAAWSMGADAPKGKAAVSALTAAGSKDGGAPSADGDSAKGRRDSVAGGVGGDGCDTSSSSIDSTAAGTHRVRAESVASATGGGAGGPSTTSQVDTVVASNKAALDGTHGANACEATAAAT